MGCGVCVPPPAFDTLQGGPAGAFLGKGTAPGPDMGAEGQELPYQLFCTARAAASIS